MARVVFTPHLQRHLSCPPTTATGTNVAEVFAALMADQPRMRGYVLDDQGGLRHHVAVFVDGEAVRDRRHLTDVVGPDAEIYVMQALSGG